MICTFFGHRDANGTIKEKIKYAVKDLINEGLTDYYVGNNGNFDYYVQVVLTEIIKENNSICMTVVLSRVDEKALFADQYHTIYPEGLENALPRFAIAKRNDWLISKSQIAIVYVKHSFSNSNKWTEKAKREGLQVINLGE